MKTDVIIPVYKPGRELLTLLDRLENQTISVRKIILMNTEEVCSWEKAACQNKTHWQKLTDQVDFARKYPNVEIHSFPKAEFDHGGTRHQGVQYSDAELFICMTQDAMPADTRLVENLIKHLSGNTAAAYARQLPGEASSEFEKMSRMFNYPQQSRYKTLDDLKELGIKTFFCSNVCAAYRRDIYDKLGGFVHHTIFNEDMIYAASMIRAGYAIAYEAGAQVIHSHDYTNVEQLRRNFDLGVSQAEHPEVFADIPSEAEGRKFVAQTWQFLKDHKRLYRFPAFCLQCAFKYAGYLLGRHYKKLPRALVLKITANKQYWKGIWTEAIK